MSKLYKLLHPDFFNGEYRFAGTQVWLPDDVRPPPHMEAVRPT